MNADVAEKEVWAVIEQLEGDYKYESLHGIFETKEEAIDGITAYGERLMVAGKPSVTELYDGSVLKVVFESAYAVDGYFYVIERWELGKMEDQQTWNHVS